jgi:hypothetical protein
MLVMRLSFAIGGAGVGGVWLDALHDFGLALAGPPNLPTLPTTNSPNIGFEVHDDQTNPQPPLPTDSP